MRKRFMRILTMCLLVVVLVTSFSVTSFAAYQPEGYYLYQDVTGYLDYMSDGINYAASGYSYEVGYCAVHPQAWGDSNWNNPIYPWGSIITINFLYDDPILTPVGELYAFQVQDTGELRNQHNYTFWWFDVYCGRGSDYGWTDSQLETWVNQNVGHQVVSYTLTY